MGIRGDLDDTKRSHISSTRWYAASSRRSSTCSRWAGTVGPVSREDRARPRSRLRDGSAGSAAWRMDHEAGDDGASAVTVPEGADFFLPVTRFVDVSAAGATPGRLRPEVTVPGRAIHGPCRSHFRGERRAGIARDRLEHRDAARAPGPGQRVRGQCDWPADQEATGGLLGSPLTGMRPTSKQVPLGLAEMPADFVNA